MLVTVEWAAHRWCRRLVACCSGCKAAASVGLVAAATALTLRLNAMTGWIMWALTTFFRQLGVVAEGMETIAQPIDLVDAAERPEPLKRWMPRVKSELDATSRTTTGARLAGSTRSA